MKIIQEKTAFAAVSELRTQMDEILAQIAETPVFLEKHNKPVAVLLDPKSFETMQAALEAASDILLAFEARKRELSSKKQDYISLEEVEKRVL